MLLDSLKKFFSKLGKKKDSEQKKIASTTPDTIYAILPSSGRTCAEIRHEPWKPSYRDANVDLEFYKSHGLDMSCGLKLKDDGLILPLYKENLKIKCEVFISDKGMPLDIKPMPGDHILIGEDEPAFVVLDIISACIIFQETGLSVAAYLGKDNIPALVRLFPMATFVTGGEGIRLAEKYGATVIDLTEDNQIIPIYDRFASGEDIAAFLGIKPAICFKPLWASLRSFRASEWILKGYIAAGPSLCLIFSPSGLGKTFFVLDLFLTLAFGLFHWHGIECRKARCLYMCAEGYAAVIPRIQCWIEQHGITDVRDVDLWIENGSITLDDPNSVVVLQKALNTRFGDKKPDIIAVDTMNLFMKGDENATQNATAFVQSLKALSSDNNCTILLVHHTGVADEKRGRGSTVFKGSLDTELRLSRGDEQDLLFFDQTKNRLGRLMDEPIAFRLEEHETSFEFESGEKVTSCILKRVDDVTVTKKQSQGSLDIGLLKEAFKKAYTEYPISMIITKEQLKAFATEHWKERGSAEISRQINPNQDTRWVGRLIKTGILKMDKSLAFFKVVNESAINFIREAYNREEASS